MYISRTLVFSEFTSTSTWKTAAHNRIVKRVYRDTDSKKLVRRCFFLYKDTFQRSQSPKGRPQNPIFSNKNPSFFVELVLPIPGFKQSIKRPSPACTSRGSRSSSNALTCNQLEDLQVRSVVKGRMSRHAMMELPNPSLMEQHKTETFQVLHLPTDLQVFRELCFKRHAETVGQTNDLKTSCCAKDSQNFLL